MCDESNGGSGSRVADDEQYEFKEVRAIRGVEARTIKKLQESGWELVTQKPGPLLQSKLTFRRPKPKMQWRLMAVLGGAALLFAIVGSMVGAIKGGGDAPQASAPPTEAAVVKSQKPSEEPVMEPKAAEPKAQRYAYQGPQYEVVTVDKNQGPAKLNQYWVYTGKFDYSTDAYKDQIRMIIADVAHAEGTDKFIVEVVTDKEIAQAESPSTYESFVEEHGMDYAIRTIPQKEKTEWVASYTGGFDPDAGEASDADKAFEVIWFIAADAEIEKWKPAAAG